MLRKAFFVLGVVGLMFANFACEDDDYSILMFDNKFDPKSHEMVVGDNVRWENNGEDAHTATFSDGPDPGTGTVSPVDVSGYIDFANAGTFSYACDFHPKMKGKIATAPVLTAPSQVVGSTATLLWASSKDSGFETIPAGWSVDAEYKAPGKKKWTSIVEDWTTSHSGTFTLEKKGKYKARARLQNDTNNKLSSGWSLTSIEAIEP